MSFIVFDSSVTLLLPLYSYCNSVELILPKTSVMRVDKKVKMFGESDREREIHEKCVKQAIISMIMRS